MRTFIAINFTQEVKEELSKTIKALKMESDRGNFTRIENMHVTLAFLGEVSLDKVNDIMKIMSQSVIGISPFDIHIGGLGKFGHQKEALYWCGIQKNRTLLELQSHLVNNLKENNFPVDDKTFKPHITLGRRCIMKPEFDEKEFAKKIIPITLKVTKIHLMKSEQIQGKLVYTSMVEANLTN